MRRTRWSVLALAVALAIVAAACTSGGGGDASGGGGGQQAAGQATTIPITLSDFTIAPSTIEAPAGSALTFTITNDGPSPHTFAVKTASKTYEGPQIESGASTTLAVPALEAGSYDVLCTIPGHDQLGMTATLVVGGSAATGASGATGATGADMTAEEMAAGHKQGVVDFVSQLTDGPLTKVNGNQPLEPTLVGGVKEFDLTVTQLSWEVSPGQFVDAMAFNGMVPGPEIRVQQGDKVRFYIQNQMDQPFTLHFHGLTVPNDMDGVPYITQDPIMPGQDFTYEFTIQDPPGMYVYHSHFNSTEQVGKGLYGALIVEPKANDWSGVYGVNPDVEFTMFLGDGPLGYTLSGKSFPATAGIVAKKGDWVLIHMANDGSLLHPMHLHGYHFIVVSEDGYPLATQNRYMADTLVVAPGSRFDILVHAVYPGAWAFHCHILPHVEGPQGMYGMVTALIVQ